MYISLRWFFRAFKKYRYIAVAAEASIVIKNEYYQYQGKLNKNLNIAIKKKQQHRKKEGRWVARIGINRSYI